MASTRKLLFLFLDGVGLGRDDTLTNPFARVSMPHLDALLGGHKLLLDGSQAEHAPLLVDTPDATLMAVDATLGIEGLPQSATGQASLLTGKNVSAWLGDHEGPKPTQPIVELTRSGTIFTQLSQRGRSSALLNAYPPRYFDSIEREYRLPGVIALSARQAGIPLKTRDDLYQGLAVSADFTAQGWRTHLGFTDAPLLTVEQAGERLAFLAQQSDLTVFEYWLTDMAGHHQDAQAAQSILEALDGVIGCLARSWDADQGLIMLTSDHGNLEDLGTRHHTLNDVPLLLIGSPQLRSEFLRGFSSTCSPQPDLTAIAPAILRFIG